MKKVNLLIIVCCLFSLINAQEAIIRIDVKNLPAKKVSFINHDYSDATVLFQRRYWSVPLSKANVIQKISLKKPLFVGLYYEDTITHKDHRYNFLLQPGDDICFSVDVKKTGGIDVTGTGSENNQPMILDLMEPLDLKDYGRDSLPAAVFDAIKTRSIANQQILDTYINKYRPSPVFKKIYNVYEQYFPVWTFINFKGEQKYSAGKAFSRNRDKWQAVEDSLVKEHSLNNPDALSIPDFVYFLPIYLIRQKELLWDQRRENASVFFKTWYSADEKEGAKMFQADMENDLRERIINRMFSGANAEFLYGVLFASAMEEKQDNVPQIFDRFRQKFPKSDYLPYLKPFVIKVKAQEAQQLTSDMVLIESPDSIKTFDDLLKLVKGKTALVDMWGTWCAPCRKSIQDNAIPLKAHFKGKELNFIYVANHDLVNRETWKKLIPYYSLTGLNILASTALTNDIMDKVKGKGFPTYIVIKPDGTYELARSEYPMKRDVLIQQLEEALASK